MSTQLEKILEQGEERFPNIVGLYNWSLNYEAGEGPMTLFLDLIGYSMEEIGGPLYSLASAKLGYLELDYLGDALKEYADRGEEAYLFTLSVISAEMGEEEGDDSDIYTIKEEEVNA